MIITERIESLGLIRRYSNNGMMIVRAQTGEVFPEVIEPISSKFTYKETNNSIEAGRLSAQAALDAIFGGNDGTV